LVNGVTGLSQSCTGGARDRGEGAFDTPSRNPKERAVAGLQHEKKMGWPKTSGDSHKPQEKREMQVTLALHEGNIRTKN